MPFRPKHKKNNKNVKNTSEQPNELIQKAFIEPIKTIVNESGIPSLKPELEKIFLEWFRLGAEINKTKDLKEISETIEKKAVDVESKYKLFKQERPHLFLCWHRTPIIRRVR